MIKQSTLASQSQAISDIQKLTDELAQVKDELLNELGLSLEYLQMLQAVINDVVSATSIIRPYIHVELLQPINTRLGIGQLLADDFISSVNHRIKNIEQA